MRKKITKTQLGKLVEAQVRKLLSEEKNSEIEQSWDEYDKTSTKNIGKAAKFSPVLAKDYNHNVEDGREGAEKYCHGLEEKILKQVKKALNEHWMDSQRHTFTDGTSILNGHGGSGAEGSLWSHNHKDIIVLANQLNRKCWDEALRLRDEYENTDDDYFDESGNVKHQIQCLEELSHFLSSFVEQAASYID